MKLDCEDEDWIIRMWTGLSGCGLCYEDRNYAVGMWTELILQRNKFQRVLNKEMKLGL